MTRLKFELEYQIYDFLFGFRKLLPFTGYPLHKNEGYKPFFIIGAGRSGNTLLRRILQAHTEIHIPPETYVLGKTIRAFRRNNHLRWEDLVHLTLSIFEHHSEFETFEIEPLQKLSEALISTPKEKRSLAFILNNFYLHHASCHHISFNRWGDKTPMNTFCLERIKSVFPDAQFIHIIRDGCDVVSSYLRAGIYSSVQDAAMRWEKSIKLASSFCHKHSKCCIGVRYEDLVFYPESIVMEICEFLEIDFQEEMLALHVTSGSLGDVQRYSHHSNVLKPITAANIGKGRILMSKKEQEELQKLIGSTLDKLGYRSCMS